MARVILIDGENLLYGLRKIAGTPEKKASREQFVDYPFKQLISDVLGDEVPAQVLYFGARLRQYDYDDVLLEKTKKVIHLQSKLVNNLQKQGISFVKVGYLRARETEPCIDCGHLEWQLLEKGVDVGLAARMFEESEKKNQIILVSSDTDLLPAVKLARKKGSEVIFVGYEYQPVLALASAADRTRLITEPMVKKYLTNSGEVVDDPSTDSTSSSQASSEPDSKKEE